ncbi:GTP-binding protein YPT31/YPT8 [Tritrichomonas foetus]|uniref:GTP-binding protein YPT31/YPT8 n=1 Tax=Tritrichomonas foetus TaxID=1144522 RepID=A0A1J4JFM1_9EUKA|nr:GTP-binding protein YPT31/YPT8 [Tritrichomonas foetus]|eukprot:OHS97912.1 GTP-binding protein YPT31/YPT8 [Tritrichomonas foetus]
MENSNIKTILIGDTAVGKSSIYGRVNSNEFNSRHNPTISGEYTTKCVISESGVEHVIGIWDTAGQERYRTIVPLFFKDAKLAFIVYDITSFDTFKNIDSWAEMARNNAPENVILFLIGNKKDLDEKRAVSFDSALEKGREMGVSFTTEVSALTNEGIDELLQMAVNCYEQNLCHHQIKEMKHSNTVKLTDTAGNGSAQQNSCPC